MIHITLFASFRIHAPARKLIWSIIYVTQILDWLWKWPTTGTSWKLDDKSKLLLHQGHCKCFWIKLICSSVCFAFVLLRKWSSFLFSAQIKKRPLYSYITLAGWLGQFILIIEATLQSLSDSYTRGSNCRSYPPVSLDSMGTLTYGQMWWGVP